MTTRRNILKGGAGLAAILATGKAPAAFVKSMLAARNSIGMKSGGEKLPYDAEVEYLESTGTQYILSQYNIIAGNIFELDISFVEDSSLGNTSVMAGRNASNYECFIRKNGAGYFGGGSFSSQFSIEYNTRYKMCFDLTAGAMSFTVNDTLLKSSSSTQPDRKQFPLFAVAAAAQNNINQIRKARIYSFKSWSGGVLVEDYIPFRVGTVGYMYARVSGQLFRNQGTGAFLWGHDASAQNGGYNLICVWRAYTRSWGPSSRFWRAAA